ncbi:MAG: AraC family transcriptional regulator [Victivallales bacterium]
MKPVTTISLEEVELFDSVDFRIQNSTFYPRERFWEHRHDYYEFFLLFEGTLAQNRNGRNEELRPRSLCFLNPEDTHALRNLSASVSVNLVNFVFKRELYEQVASSTLTSLNFNPRDGATLVPGIAQAEWSIVNAKTQMLLENATAMSYKQQLALFKSLLVDVLLLLDRHDSAGPADMPEWLENACVQMRRKENYRCGISRFVELAGRTQEHLTRCMRQYLDTTPQKYVLSLRLDEAAQLLRNSRKPIFELMNEVGFNNESYFRRCFTKKFGCSPKRYSINSRRMFNPSTRY